MPSGGVCPGCCRSRQTLQTVTQKSGLMWQRRRGGHLSQSMGGWNIGLMEALKGRVVSESCEGAGILGGRVGSIFFAGAFISGRLGVFSSLMGKSYLGAWNPCPDLESSHGRGGEERSASRPGTVWAESKADLGIPQRELPGE